MIKTIEIDGKNVKFDTSLSWMFVYKMQFGTDPIDIIMPAIKAAAFMTLGMWVDYITEWNNINLPHEKGATRKATQEDFDKF